MLFSRFTYIFVKLLELRLNTLKQVDDEFYDKCKIYGLVVDSSHGCSPRCKS